MKNFNLNSLLIFLLSILFLSCSSDENLDESEIKNENYAILHLGPMLNLFNDNQNRQALSDIPDCSDTAPGFAQISLTYGENEIENIIVEILEDENGLFTAFDEILEIPIPAGSNSVTVTLNEFLVWNNDGGEPGTIIWAAPKTGSEFSGFVENSLPFSWVLRAGTKNYVDVEVLCFDDRLVNQYGYVFFDIIPEVIYELCFFANYCSDEGRHYSANYSLNLYYGTNSNGIPLYTNQSPEIGEESEFYADPLCLAIPAPQNGEGFIEPYLYYELDLLDWPDNYGLVNGRSISGTLSWKEVQDLLNDDGETSEYLHLFVNCNDGVSECGEFEAIPESSFYETINPSVPVDYFELITYLDDEIIFSFSKGELCADAADKVTCVDNFENLIAEEGFLVSCLPAGCYTFIREQTDEINDLVTTDEELLDFLGPIDSKGDALLLAFANNYYWVNNSVETSAIKEGCSGYELKVDKIVSYCLPLQIDRFLLRITLSGEIIILDQETIDFNENLCI